MKKNLQGFIAKNKWLKYVPNSLTLCNSLCGFSAILYTLFVYDNPQASPESILAISAWIILFAMVFDALDGYAARIFNATSMHGVQMDSLADMVTFGVAPAVVVAITAHKLRPAILPEMETWQYFFIWGLCGIYLGCAALRLATYNVHAILEKKSGDKFYGLPSPGAAAAICSIVIFYSERDEEMNQIITILPFYVAFLGLLMVSKIQYQHMGKWIISIKRNKKRLFLGIIVLCCTIYSPRTTIAIIINLYILSGPFMAIIRKLIRKS